MQPPPPQQGATQLASQIKKETRFFNAVTNFQTANGELSSIIERFEVVTATVSGAVDHSDEPIEGAVASSDTRLAQLEVEVSSYLRNIRHLNDIVCVLENEL